MRALVLCAGQGKRLLPLTERLPKCLLPVDDRRSVLEFQLEALSRAGVTSASIVVGFGADHVEERLARANLTGIDVAVVFNPFFAVSDNLVSCWAARGEMQGDFLLLNGDTVFEDRVLERVLADTSRVAVTVDRKPRYDDDDMKVVLDGARLTAIGKTLPAHIVNAESIGLIAFRGDGAARFRRAIDRAVRRPEAMASWYLSAVDDMAREGHVGSVDISGRWWREIDDRTDLEDVQACIQAVATGTGPSVSCRGRLDRADGPGPPPEMARHE